MRNKLCLLTFFLISLSLYSQDTGFINEDEGVSKDSYNNNNENITVPLYTVTSDDVEVPVYLSYNSAGMRVNDIPSSVGFGWNLHVGGEIEKTINHLVDENEKGWLFVNGEDQYTNSCGSSSQEPLSNQELKNLFENVDSEPDLFTMSISNGDNLSYIYPRRNLQNPIILNQNGNFYGNSIDLDVELIKQYDFRDNNQFYQDDDDADIKVTNKQGVAYYFRKGISRIIPYGAKRNRRDRIDSTEVKNYYVHKISASYNNSTIKFDYTDNRINKYIRYTKATRNQTNSDIYTPPSPSDPINTGAYYDDIVIEDMSRKEVKSITTAKEKIEFVYINSWYDPGNIEISNGSGSFQFEDFVKPQSIKLLRQIKIYDHKDNYKGGYYFIYTRPEQGDPSSHEGALKIKQILKQGINESSFVYREFDYFNTDSGNYPTNTNSGYYSATTAAQDVFGYPNGEITNGQSNNLTIQLQGNNRMPNVTELKKGMLKSIKNPEGGVLEYDYIENSYGSMYYGGLLINSIKEHDYNGAIISVTNYEYSEPEGFGLPVYDQTQYGQGVIPNGVYDEGFFDLQIPMYHAWQTFFTQLDDKTICQDNSYINYYNVSNIPFSLYRNTPGLDSFLQGGELQVQPEPIIEYGSFYKKIKEEKINVESNQSEKGYIIRFYRPTFVRNQLDKELEKIEYYNNSNIKVKEKLFNYDFVVNGSVGAYKFKNNHASGFSYRIEHYNIYALDNVLKSVDINMYDNFTGSHLSNTKSSFNYLNQPSTYADYTSLKEIIKSYNGEIYERIENKFFREYYYTQEFAELSNKMNPIVETNIWKKSNNEWILKSSTVKSLYGTNKIQEIRKIFGNNLTKTYYKENNFTPSFYDEYSSELISVDTDDVVSYSYDENQRIKAQIDEKNNTYKVYQRSDEYDGLYIDAILTTKEPYTYEDMFFLKKSFENPEEENVIKHDKAFSGDYVFTGSSIDLGNFPAGYRVSFWVYETNQWRINAFVHQGGNLTIIKPNNASYIDEIIVKPKNSSVVSYTHIPLFATTSVLNDRGEGERIEYDVYGRPLLLFDKDKNVIKEFKYNTIDLEILHD